MFRSNNNRDSDDSDDEGERFRKKPELPVSNDSEEFEPKKKRANNVWSDVVLEQSLEDRGARVNLDKGDKSQRVYRAAESYEIPKDHLLNQEANVFNEPPIVTVTPASDDPFGDTVDLSAVEGFAGASSSSSFRGGRGRGRGRGGRPFYRQQGGPGRDEKTGEDEAMSVDGESKSVSGGGPGWMRGRGRGRIWQHRGGYRGGGPQGMKRTWNGGPFGKVSDPSKLLTREYSLESLMSTEFTAGLGLTELGKEMAMAMGENDPTTVTKIVEAIGEEKALTLFEETRQVESGGGMKIADGSRRRTPGGVFISLFKSDGDISVEIKDQIFELNKQETKKFLKAKRRKNLNFDDQLKEVADLMQKEKEKDQVEEGLPPLPDVSEVLKRAPAGEETGGQEGEEELDFEEEMEG